MPFAIVYVIFVIIIIFLLTGLFSRFKHQIKPNVGEVEILLDLLELIYKHPKTCFKISQYSEYLLDFINHCGFDYHIEGRSADIVCIFPDNEDTISLEYKRVSLYLEIEMNYENRKNEQYEMNLSLRAELESYDYMTLCNIIRQTKTGHYTPRLVTFRYMTREQYLTLAEEQLAKWTI